MLSFPAGLSRDRRQRRQHSSGSRMTAEFRCLISVAMARDVLAAIVVTSLLTSPGMTSSDDGDNVGILLRIGVIVPDDPSRMFARRKVLPAVHDALTGNGSDVISKLVPRVRFAVLDADSRCSSAVAPIAAIDLHYVNKVHVFLGPVCDYSVAPVARYSPYWNIPVISPGAMAHDFGADKRPTGAEFGLLTRVGATFDSLARCLYSTLQHFHWTHTVKVAYVTNGQSEVMTRFCYLAMSAVVNEMRLLSRPVDLYPIVNNNGDVDDDEVQKLLRDEIGVSYAIVVLCASPDTVREIMIEADRLNFNNGDYVFFNIDLFSSRELLETPWRRHNDTEERNAAARRGYESVLTLTLRRPNSSEYERFTERVRQRALQDYGYDVYGNEVNSFVGAFHDAMLLYALAVRETLDAGLDPTNGTEVTARMWNRTFQGITGTVSIDANGDRSGDYSLLDMDPFSGHFHSVGDYFGARKQFDPVVLRSIHWGGGRIHPPPDDPHCGFDGSKCLEDGLPEYAIAAIVLGSLLVVVFLAVALLAYRHHRLEAELLAEANWRVKWEDIQFGGCAVSRYQQQQQQQLDRNGSRYGRVCYLLLTFTKRKAKSRKNNLLNSQSSLVEVVVINLNLEPSILANRH